jgi:hypothetical protein
MAEQQQASSGGSKLVWLLVLALLGAVWWLASERNARHFTYEVRGGELLVSKGRYFPTTTAAIGPGDPLGKVYAGIQPPAGVKPIAEVEVEDQVSLDRALYELITGWARAAAKARDAAGQQQAEELVARVSQLSGLTPAQLSDLQTLRAELGWWSAARDLDQAVKQLAVARRKLEEVRRGDVEHAAQATAMLTGLDALSLQLAELSAGRGGTAAAVVPAAAAPEAPAAKVPGAEGEVAKPGAASNAAVEPAKAPAPPARPAPAAPAKEAQPAEKAPAAAPVRAGAPTSKSSGAPR